MGTTGTMQGRDKDTQKGREGRLGRGRQEGQREIKVEVPGPAVLHKYHRRVFSVAIGLTVLVTSPAITPASLGLQQLGILYWFSSSPPPPCPLVCKQCLY